MKAIDVEKIKEALWKKCDEYDFEDDFHSGVMYGLTKAIQIIDEPFTIEPEKRGKWLEIGKQHIMEWQRVNKCSLCGRIVSNTSCIINGVDYFEYCPRCGAKMEK